MLFGAGHYLVLFAFGLFVIFSTACGLSLLREGLEGRELYVWSA
jgi:hypothetical protein